MSEVTRAEIREALIAALANVEGVCAEEIEAAAESAGGDALYELDSKVAECVIAEVGEAFSVTLGGPADLLPEQYATLEALLDMLQDQISAAAKD